MLEGLPTGKPATIMHTAVQETEVSRYRGVTIEGTPENPLNITVLWYPGV